ncbi:MAG: tRNA glutamyl-Q(34) synthetase GluQRS [Duncaniella sp.]
MKPPAILSELPVGRYAPSPTGRMHLGNLYSALLSWLSVRSRGGRWVLRIEDLDPQRSKAEYTRLIEDDLKWLGLDYDEGGTADIGPNGPYSQSRRGAIYEEYLHRLHATGYTYPCTCTRADIMTTQAPHRSDGRVIYGGRCRPADIPCMTVAPVGVRHSTRLYVPDQEIMYTDRVYGPQSVNLSHECGDFILRRADGAWAYQLAVVVDDALMGINEVVRGSDLLLSAAQQIYLYRLLGLPAPAYAHVPLICNSKGQRLSKRDRSLNMEYLRGHFSSREIIGKLAHMAGLIPEPSPCTAHELIGIFDWAKVPRTPEYLIETL